MVTDSPPPIEPARPRRRWTLGRLMIAIALVGAPVALIASAWRRYEAQARALEDANRRMLLEIEEAREVIRAIEPLPAPPVPDGAGEDGPPTNPAGGTGVEPSGA